MHGALVKKKKKSVHNLKKTNNAPIRHSLNHHIQDNELNTHFCVAISTVCLSKFTPQIVNLNSMGTLHNFQLTALSESSSARYCSFYCIKITRKRQWKQARACQVNKNTHEKPNKLITWHMTYLRVITYSASQDIPCFMEPECFYLALGLNPEQVKSKHITSYL